MKYKRIIPQRIEAVQLLSQRIDGDKVITKWSNASEWLNDAIKARYIRVGRGDNLVIGGNPDMYGDGDYIFEGDWVINEIDNRYIIDLYTMERDYFLNHYTPEHMNNIYTHEFDIK